jgi:hypothetical protein
MSPSSRRRARRTLFRSLSMLPAAALCACAGQPPVFLNAQACSTLIPDAWAKAGVPSAPLPPDKSVGEWIAFGDAQTGQLDIANARTADALAIITACETRDRAAQDAMKPWWRLW